MSEEKGKTKEKSTFSFWNFFKRDKKKKEKGKKTLEKQVSKDDVNTFLLIFTFQVDSMFS